MAKLGGGGWKSGDVRIWTKPLIDIPKGWQLCDGTNGTPELVDRAVVGAGRDYSPNQKFGNDSRTPAKPSVSVNVDNHTLSKSQLAAHDHMQRVGSGSGSKRYPKSDGSIFDGAINGERTLSEGSTQPHNHGTSVSVGNVGAVDTRQQSIAVYWIMKL